MNNVFNSVMFPISYVNYHPRKVKTQGFFRKSGRGVTPCVIQEPITGNQEELERSTVEVVVIRGYY